MNIDLTITIGVAIGIIGAFYKRGKKVIDDSQDLPIHVTWKSFLKDSIIDIIGSLILLAVVAFGLDKTGMTGDPAIDFLGATATGNGIPGIVSNWLLSIFGITGDKARRKNREAMAEQSKKAEFADLVQAERDAEGI